MLKMIPSPLTYMCVSCLFPDALGSVLLCQRPAVDGPKAAVPRPLPHVGGLRGRPPRDGTARRECSLYCLYEGGKILLL